MDPERVKFSAEAGLVLRHFSAFARQIARSDADEQGLRGLPRMMFVHRKAKEFAGLRMEFTRQVLGQIVESACHGTKPKPVLEILVDLDCKL